MVIERHLVAFELTVPVHLQWTNPRGTDRVLGRYAPGRTAPEGPLKGRPMRLAAKAHWQGIGEGNRLSSIHDRGQAREKAGAQVVSSLQRLAELDAVLSLEVTAG